MKKIATYFLDTETFNIGNPLETEVQTIDNAVYAIGIGKSTWVRHLSCVKTGTGLDALEKGGKGFLDELLEKQERCVQIFIYNAIYDVQYIFKFLVEKYGQDVDPEVTLTDDGHWVFGSIKIKKYGIRLRFKCLWIWDKTKSLQAGSDVLPIKKGSLGEGYAKGNLFKKGQKLFYYDAENKLQEFDTKAERIYLEKDVLSLPYLLDYINNTRHIVKQVVPGKRKIDWEEDAKDLWAATTKAGFAKQTIQLFLGESFNDTFKPPITKEDFILQDRSYLGGFVANNTNSKYGHLNLTTANIIALDINSMYPYLMSHFALPYGPLLNEKPDTDEYCTGYIVQGTSLKYKEEYKEISTGVFSTSFETIVLDRLEEGELSPPRIVLKDYWDVVLELCDTDFVITDVKYQATTGQLKEFFENLYAKRREIKEEIEILKASGDTTSSKYLELKDIEETIKLLMNSGYGKFAEKPHDKYVDFTIDEGGKKRVRTEEELSAEGAYTSILTGCFVTTKGRIMILTTIKEIIDNPNLVFLYCDTDSVRYWDVRWDGKDLTKRTPVSFKIDNVELGAGKIEGLYTTFACAKVLKRYLLYNQYTKAFKFAVGGFNKKMLHELATNNIDDAIAFFLSQNNIKVIKGKRRPLRGTDKWALTRLIDSDIYTTSRRMPVTHIIEKIDGVGTLNRI